uniref:Serine/threonine-protein kinase BSK1-like TPR repeats domain-containing protein n=1 Tax=Pyrodinium bahamense TaxID=73915 RepID=A0A7S0B842_9DINO
MEPQRGSLGDLSWMHFTGTVQLRLALRGSTWEGVAAEDFEVRVCPEELTVRCTSGRGVGNLEAISGRLRKEVSPQGCWYDIEGDLQNPFSKSRVLVVELAKKAPGKPWADAGLFHDSGLFHRRPFHWHDTQQDQGQDDRGWVKLKPGRRSDVEDPFVTSRGWLCTEFEQGQTEELVEFRIILDQKKLDQVLEKVPYFNIFGADCSETAFRLFIRGDESSPILLGTLGGKVIPDETFFTLTKITREVEGHRIRGTMETLPCLEITLRKAEDSLGEWCELIDQDEEILNQPQGSLEDFERKQLKMQREPSPDRDDWTPDDWADEQKDKADAAFKRAEYRDAIVYYTRALRYTPTEPKLLSNRSAAYLKISKFQLALEDAEKAEKIEPNWPKVYFRKGAALKGLKKYDDAIVAFQNGQDIDPTNTEWDREIQRAREMKAQLLERKKQQK